jgi:hypothetical protein
VRACDTEHDYEVFSIGRFHPPDSNSFPEQAEVDAEVENLCDDTFQKYVGTLRESSELHVDFLRPIRETWIFGDDDIACLVFDPKGPVSESLRNSGR